MLNLSNLRKLLLQVLALPGLHTAVLFTPSGQLVSYVSEPSKPKDHVRVVVGLSTEIWKETKELDMGRVDCEIGRLLVLPVEQPRTESTGSSSDNEPILLLALNADDSVSWGEMEQKAKRLVQYLEQPVKDLHKKLAAAPTSPIATPPRPPR